MVDASLVMPLLHQNHNYNHVSGGREQAWRGQEAERNLHLYGGTEHAYTLLDVTHELTPDGSVRSVRFRISKITALAESSGSRPTINAPEHQLSPLLLSQPSAFERFHSRASTR